MVTPTRKPLAHARQAEVVMPENAPYKLNAGDGLFLQVMPNGSKHWRLRYFYLGKEKMLSVGLFPATGLQAAKDARDAGKKLLAKGTAPSQQRADYKAVATSRWWHPQEHDWRWPAPMPYPG